MTFEPASPADVQAQSHRPTTILCKDAGSSAEGTIAEAAFYTPLAYGRRVVL